MASYAEIQDYVYQNYRFVPETCWIAHVKEICGLRLRKAHNRKGEKRIRPCPPEKIESIKNAFKHFKMI